MRHFKLVVCALIMLFISGVASAQQDIINITWRGTHMLPRLRTCGYQSSRGSPVIFISEVIIESATRSFKVTLRTLTVLAGNGYAGFSGDGGLATDLNCTTRRASRWITRVMCLLPMKAIAQSRSQCGDAGNHHNDRGPARCGLRLYRDSVPGYEHLIRTSQPGVAIARMRTCYIADYYNQAFEWCPATP